MRSGDFPAQGAPRPAPPPADRGHCCAGLREWRRAPDAVLSAGLRLEGARPVNSTHSELAPTRGDDVRHA